MVSTDWNKTRVTETTPHELSVRKFAETRSDELQTLHTIVSNRLTNDFRAQRNKRRRTTSHDDRIARKRSRNKKSIGFGDLGKDDKPKKVSRRVRRSVELKRNPVSGFSVSGDGSKRLRTHVWLAKRFTMTKTWGFCLPLGVNGSGRGSRALLKKLRTGVLLHDASYCGAVQLKGRQDLVLAVLGSVLKPSPSVDNEKQLNDILSGEVFGSAMLHCAGEQFSHPIAPVTYMWRPLQQIFSNTECSSSSIINGEQRICDGTSVRQVWVWIHAAAFREAYDALSSACKSQLDIAGGPVECISLEGQLAKLEVIGSQSVQLLKKTLIPVSSSFEKSEHGDHEVQVETSIVENNQNSSSEVITLTVMDPRASTKEENVIVHEQRSNSFLRECDKSLSDSSLSNNGMQNMAGCSSLWDLSEGISTPMDENDICMEKHNKREEFFCLGRKSSRAQDTSVEGKNCRWCPILMLKNNNPGGSIIRCSVILPLCWAKIFWNAFVLKGAHAIGLRERQWIASEMGLPCFPLDFPDCNAYTHTMAMEKVDMDQKASLLPPSKKPPLEVPIPPPWHCVKLHYKKQSDTSHSLVKECGFMDEIHDDSLKNSDSVKSDTKMLDSLSVSFEGHISRTASELCEFLKSGNHLYLFSSISDQSSCMYKVMKQEEFPTQEIISDAEHNTGRCFVRVFLHAYRKGVFEQGAVVCAPNAADIKLLTGSEDENQLQLPESELKSYFVRLASGEWEIKEPEDSALRESFRLPMGFVTTGFVRGSKRAVAGAYCEATLLSRVRMEQWRESPVKKRKEIYVLVRNMRSTAYRLALATIVLEQKDDDVDFM